MGNPTFPISFSVEDVVKRIEKILKEKHWHKFDVGEVKLVYIPYYIFNCDCFSEDGGKVSEKHTGRQAINIASRELNEKVAQVFDENEEKLINTIEEKYPSKVKKATISESDVEEIAKLKVATWKGVGKGEVIISGGSMIYFPTWVVYVSVAEGTYKFEISAVDGQRLFEEKVPTREKGFLEITSDTISELKEPRAWLRYTKGVALETGKIVAKRSIWQKIFSLILYNRTIQLAIVAIIIVILIIWFSR